MLYPPYLLPSGEYSQSDLDRYRDSLLRPVQEQNQNKLISFAKDFAKGGVQNIASIFEGIERRVNDNIQKMGKDTKLTDYEIRANYAKKYGLPSDSRAYDMGKLISEILLLLVLSTVTIESVPTIVAFMIYSFIQILGSKAIKYARYEDDKKFTEGLINDIANYFITELLTRGLIKVTDKTNIFNLLKDKLKKLWEKIEKYILDNIGQPVRQANGTIIFKKYNGDTATPEEFYEHVLKNFRKKVQERAKKREIVKKRLQKDVRTVKIDGVTYKEIWLPKSEYRKVMKVHHSELSAKQQESIIYQNDIFPYRYYVINNGFDDPIIVGKELLDDNYRL